MDKGLRRLILDLAKSIIEDRVEQQEYITMNEPSNHRYAIALKLYKELRWYPRLMTRTELERQKSDE